MKTLRAAIVGCGGIARMHARVLATQEGAEMVACADRLPERAASLANDYGLTPYSTLTEMLDKEAIDVLHITTPHPLHTPMAELAHQRGVHVLLEKPAAVTRDQLTRLLALTGPARVGVCFQNRFIPPTEAALALIQGGSLGAFQGGRATVNWCRLPEYYTLSDWRGRWATEGGGVLINQAIHTLDLLVYLLGKPEVKDVIMSRLSLEGIIEVEDTAVARLQFQGMPVLFFATNANAFDAPVCIELVFAHGNLLHTPDALTLTRTDEEPQIIGKNDAMPLEKGYWGTGHSLCLANFYTCIRTGAPFLNEPLAVQDSQEAMLAMYDAYRAQCGAVVPEILTTF